MVFCGVAGLLSSKFSQYTKFSKRENLSNCNVKKEKNVYNKQKIQVFFSINTGFIFILWYKNCGYRYT
jgi:hypothetical protein